MLYEGAKIEEGDGAREKRKRKPVTERQERAEEEGKKVVASTGSNNSQR